MRIFLGVFPPPEVQQAAARVIDSLRRAGDGVSWVKPDNLHYTLRFMGELGQSGLERVAEAARRAAAEHRGFEAVLGEPGAFPSPGRARVLWLGMSEGGAALEGLAGSLERELRSRGFDPADRGFKSHLTLGRVRDRDQDWSERLLGIAPSGARFGVDRVLVIESTLSPQGSTYRVRAEALLGPRTGGN